MPEPNTANPAGTLPPQPTNQAATPPQPAVQLPDSLVNLIDYLSNKPKSASANAKKLWTDVYRVAAERTVREVYPFPDFAAAILEGTEARARAATAAAEAEDEDEEEEEDESPDPPAVAPVTSPSAVRDALIYEHLKRLIPDLEGTLDGLARADAFHIDTLSKKLNAAARQALSNDKSAVKKLRTKLFGVVAGDKVIDPPIDRSTDDEDLGFKHVFTASCLVPRRARADFDADPEKIRLELKEHPAKRDAKKYASFLYDMAQRQPDSPVDVGLLEGTLPYLVFRLLYLSESAAFAKTSDTFAMTGRFKEYKTTALTPSMVAYSAVLARHVLFPAEGNAVPNAAPADHYAAALKMCEFDGVFKKVSDLYTRGLVWPEANKPSKTADVAPGAAAAAAEPSDEDELAELYRERARVVAALGPVVDPPAPAPAADSAPRRPGADWQLDPALGLPAGPTGAGRIPPLGSAQAPLPEPPTPSLPSSRDSSPEAEQPPPPPPKPSKARPKPLNKRTRASDAVDDDGADADASATAPATKRPRKTAAAPTDADADDAGNDASGGSGKPAAKGRRRAKGAAPTRKSARQTGATE